jgi:hypothetical protein
VLGERPSSLAGLGDVEAGGGVGGEALGVHAVEDGDAAVDVVVQLDAVLAFVGAQQPADVLDDASFEREEETTRWGGGGTRRPR